MALDPSIILAGGQINDPNKMLELKQNMQKITATDQSMQRQNALRGLLSNPQSYQSGQLTPQARQAVMGLDPETGIELQKQDYNQQALKFQQQAVQTETGKKKFDLMTDLAGSGVNAYDEAKKAGKSEEEARSAGQQARNEAADTAYQTGSGLISDQEYKQVTSTPFDPLKASALAGLNKEWSTNRQRSTEEKDSVAAKAASLAETTRADKASEAQRSTGQQIERERIAKTNAPTEKYSSPGEVEYTDKAGHVKRVDAVFDPTQGRYLTAVGFKPIEGDEFRPIKGGEAGLGNRSEVFFNRVTAAGNEAAKAAQNIMELPITSDRGAFGGRSQGSGLLEAGKETLANKMTTQEVQDYNSMVAGVTRNLATIESSGLSPSGSLTHNMDAVVLKDGDTNITKMRKMAEMRQIVELGLEPNLVNPKIPVEQKDFVRKIMDDMKTAIPFTQHDVTMFERNGKKAETIADFSKRINDTKPKDAPEDAKMAPDGKWYTQDPSRPGKYLRWD